MPAAELLMDDEKALKWLNLGAIPSDTVRSLLSRWGIMMAFDMAKKGISQEEINLRVTAHRQSVEGKLKAKKAAAKPVPVVAATVKAEPALKAEAASKAEPETGSADKESENTPTEESAS